MDETVATEQIAIRIDGVSKDFHLPDERLSSVKSHIIHPFKRRNYKVQHALKDINVDIKQGEFFGIVGRNGSGKSTLLKIIAGIYQPTKGQVSVRGKLVPFIELGVGFNPELTGKENVYLNGALLGFSKKEIDAQYNDIVAFAELKKFMNQKLKNYSSGMQVRLAFSMAVRANADILLIDEVLAVGDADFQRKCFDYFNELKKTKMTVVFVSHNMDAVQKYCDRAMLIEDSRVIEIGNTTKVAEEYIKLFTEHTTEATISEGADNRWGDGSLKIEKNTAIVSAKAVTIRETFRALSDTPEPVAGLRIRSSSGQSVTGTNSELERIILPDMKSGDCLELEWQVPNIFSDGKYYVDLVATHSPGLTVAVWWDEANRFTIKKARPLPYPIDPEINLKIIK